MNTTIALKIDVTKIDKQRLYIAKSGAKYLDAVVLLCDEVDQYGNNGMIVESVSKEEREAGQRGTILGNCKILSRPQPQQGVTTQKVQETFDAVVDDNSDNLPF